MKNNEKFVLTPGATLKLQTAVRRSLSADMATIEWLSAGNNLDLVASVACGLARIQTIDKSEHIVKVDRTKRPLYPDFIEGPIRQDWELSGPSEFDIAQLQPNFYERDEDSGWAYGPRLFEQFGETPIMSRALTLLDLEAIVAKGPEFYFRHFGDRYVIAWKSVVRVKDQTAVSKTLYPRIELRSPDCCDICWVCFETMPVSECSLSPCFPS